MAVGTTDTLTNSIRARYQNAYDMQIFAQRVYDMLADPVGDDMSKFIAGSSVVIPYLSKMNIGTSAINEYTDVTPQALRDATATVTPTSRGEALQQSELLQIQNYAENFEAETLRIVAENATESIDLLAQAQALQGGLIFRAAARASLDAGTATHRLTELEFTKASNALYEFKVPMWMPSGNDDLASGGRNGSWFAIVHPDAYYDLRAGGNVVTVGEQQRAEIIMDSALGALDKFQIIVPPWGKVFGGAGADNGTAVATTLSAAENKLDKVIAVASASNITVGRYLTIGTEETGDTHYETNERVKVISVSGTDITIAGAGSNGGLRFDHASGVAVRNADSVYPTVFGGPGSLKKWWDPGTGEFGKLLMKEKQGLLEQWISYAWKFYGAYARPVENRIVRAENSSSLDA
jgi:N4-gp56 family major capsid protein